MDNTMVRPVSASVMSQLSLLMWSMMTRQPVVMTSNARDAQVLSVVNRVTCEDGSGERYIVDFSNGESLYADLGKGFTNVRAA